MTEGRVLALDLGTVRVGVALSDPTRRFAQPLDVLPAQENWIQRVQELVVTHQVTLVLVGLPTRTDGTAGPEVERVRGWTEELRQGIPQVPIQFYDERFTTRIAQQALLAGDVSRKGRKQRVDKVAAAVLLQGFLDGEAAGGRAS